ncbi:GntR family transcriptional regulator [Ruoffia tabacinasalis]|uniref:GntR family transcriptional regulator n=1 Tax=Ruoffia tabacinasalis TaxID=87458 RepID=A0A5R9DRL5_9LACT|nr:GntR family transcriptional regulator [Ruoffia tabacinasalis]
MYDVSRHIIREAISILVKEEFVRKEKGSGSYVSFDPNNNQFAKGKPLFIGVVTTYMSDYIFPSIIRGNERELNNENISLLISSTHNNYSDEENALRKMMSNEVDGLIIEPTKSSYFNPNTNLYLELTYKRIPFMRLEVRILILRKKLFETTIIEKDSVQIIDLKENENN